MFQVQYKILDTLNLCANLLTLIAVRNYLTFAELVTPH